MKITVVGIGYVGLSIGLLLAKEHDVTFFDIDNKKIDLINKRQSSLKEAAINKLLCKTKNINATSSEELAYKDATFIILSLPTNLKVNKLDTSIIEISVSNILKINKKATIVIKSTVPIGFTEYLRNRFHYNDIIFSPEFLREGSTIHDQLYPSRTIVGNESRNSQLFLDILTDISVEKDSPSLLVDSSEAEAIKLFSNAYLAQKIAFFNELDTFAEMQNLDSKKIIEAIGYDQRIGNSHNNPSFGFGGYCLPKDIKQLEYHFKEIPAPIITSISESNLLRKIHIAKMILNSSAKTIGIYRINSKKDSDNCRESSTIDVAKLLKSSGKDVIIFEPLINQKKFLGCPLINDFNEFIKYSDIIVANRIDDALRKCNSKVFTRDIFQYD
ncbi:TPA: nucleotide sugar dehydrogenase [Streptococcus pyogenes]